MKPGKEMSAQDKKPAKNREKHEAKMQNQY
jgi:hypothetical protein